MRGTLRLSTTSPAQSFTEPLTLAEVEHYLALGSLSPSDSERDDLLEGLISSARNLAEYFQKRDLVRKQWDLYLDCLPACAVQLGEPLVSVDKFEITGWDGVVTTLVEGTDFIVDVHRSPGEVRPPWGQAWPAIELWPSSAVLVRFTSGLANTDAFWADDGKRVKSGMKLLISEWFNNRIPWPAPGTPIADVVMAQCPNAVWLLRQGAVNL